MTLIDWSHATRIQACLLPHYLKSTRARETNRRFRFHLGTANVILRKCGQLTFNQFSYTTAIRHPIRFTERTVIKHQHHQQLQCPCLTLDRTASNHHHNQRVALISWMLLTIWRGSSAADFVERRQIATAFILPFRRNSPTWKMQGWCFSGSQKAVSLTLRLQFFNISYKVTMMQLS